jgi:hypothetical protein
MTRVLAPNREASEGLVYQVLEFGGKALGLGWREFDIHVQDASAPSLIHGVPNGQTVDQRASIIFALFLIALIVDGRLFILRCTLPVTRSITSM